MFEEGIIRRVDESDIGFMISTKDASSFWLDKEWGATPKVGDTIKLYLVNGSTVRGVELNGILLYYKDDDWLEQERQDWLAKYAKEKQERFEAAKAGLDADYLSLPDNFKQRIDRFRANNPKFRVDYESYEMFCCKEALKIAAARETSGRVKWFARTFYEKQVKLCPDLSDQHSGNTFGAACWLAYVHLKWPERICQIYGALSPLVGSKEYGDIVPDSQTKEEVVQ